VILVVAIYCPSLKSKKDVRFRGSFQQLNKQKEVKIPAKRSINHIAVIHNIR